MSDLDTLHIGSRICIHLADGDSITATLERRREPDTPGADRLITDRGTLRWDARGCSWWEQRQAGEKLTAVDVRSVEPAQRTHGTFEVVDGVPTVWVRLHGPDGPLVPVRRPR
jgi:hypothetical protein